MERTESKKRSVERAVQESDLREDKCVKWKEGGEEQVEKH